MPEISPRPLYPAQRRRFTWLAGADPLADMCVEAIEQLIVCNEVARKRPKGHTKAKWIAECRRVENRMRRGHDGPEITRKITDPLFGVADETFERLVRHHRQSRGGD